MPDERLRPASPRRNLLLRRAQRRALRRDEQATEELERLAGPPPAWQVVLRDFVLPNRSQAVMAVIFFVTGLLIVMGVQARTREADFSTMSRPDLIAMLDTLNADAGSLRGEIEELRRTKEQLQHGADANAVAQQESRKRLQALELLAGTVPAYGPGIQITIFDPQRKVTPELVQHAVEEMRDAGAEVIEINDKVRVVASSWFGRAADGSIVVDGQALEFPLRIDVIGDPATLEGGARFRGGLITEVQNERVGGSVSVVSSRSIEIEALASQRAPQFSRPG